MKNKIMIILLFITTFSLAQKISIENWVENEKKQYKNLVTLVKYIEKRKNLKFQKIVCSINMFISTMY